MKNRHLYTVIAGAFLLLSATNLTTLYLYMKEKIQHHRAEAKTKTLNQKWQTETDSALANYRKDVQKRFLETVRVFQAGKEEQAQIKQNLVSALTRRGKNLQAFYTNRQSGMNDALKIIQEDSQIFSFYNQYLQYADGREAIIVDRTKQLGVSLGVGAKAEQR